MSSDQLAGIKSLPGIGTVCLGKSFRNRQIHTSADEESHHGKFHL